MSSRSDLTPYTEEEFAPEQMANTIHNKFVLPVIVR